MPRRLLPTVAAFITLVLVYFVGVVFFLDPVLEADAPNETLVHPGVALLIASLAYIAFFEWMRSAMGNATKAALAIAISQFLLVDFDYVLSGKRGIEAAAASAVLLLVAWISVALVYNSVSKRLKRGSDN